MRSRDRVGLAILTTLSAWFTVGPERAVLDTELRSITESLVPDLTDAEFQGGRTWASGITAVAALRESAPFSVTAQLAHQIEQILREVGGDPAVIPLPLWRAMGTVLDQAEASIWALQARARLLLSVAETGFRKGMSAADPATAVGSAVNLCDTLTEEGRYDEAVAVSDECLARFGNDTEGIEPALAALSYNRAVAMRSNGAPTEAASAFADVADRFQGSDDPQAKRSAARARLNQSALYLKSGDPDRALATTDDFLDHFDSDQPTPWWDSIGNILVNRATALVMLDRLEDASAICDEVDIRFDGVQDPIFAVIRVKAALVLGRALAQAVQVPEAIAAYRRSSQVVDGGVGSEELTDLIRQAEAMAGSLEVQLRLEDLQRYDAYLARLAGKSDPTSRLARAAAMVNRGMTLSQLARLDDAIADYDALIADIGDDPDPELRLQTAMAQLNRGNAYRQMDDLDEALAAYAEVERRFADATDPRVRFRAAAALLNQGGIWLQRDDAAQARKKFLALDQRFGADTAVELRDTSLSALWNIALTSLDAKQPNDAVAAIRRIIERFGDDASDQIRRRVVAYLIHGASELQDLHRAAEARELLLVIGGHRDDPDPEVRDLAYRGGILWQFQEEP